MRLNSDVAGTIVGTIHGGLPLWFDHDGVTDIRTPHQGPGSDSTSIHDDRAVAPA